MLLKIEVEELKIFKSQETLDINLAHISLHLNDIAVRRELWLRDVKAFAHGTMDRRIDPSSWTH